MIIGSMGLYALVPEMLLFGIGRSLSMEIIGNFFLHFTVSGGVSGRHP